MSAIQAVSYPVSAVVQSQQQLPPRDSSASAAAPKPSAAPATVSPELAAVSSRVNAFLAIDRSNATSGTRPDARSPDTEASEASADGGNAIDLDEAQIYQPSSLY
ncbi:MAG: hypothetical protein Q8S27_00920 [Hoeflea sp.]|nr:hypothetical protein [Hoeflea sp.]